MRIGPDMRMAVVGSPPISKHPLPETPQDLTAHNCINIASADLWRPVRLGARKGRPRGQGARRRASSCSTASPCRLNSALDGLGLAYLPEDQVLEHIAKGASCRVLEDWCPFPGYHLYYPSRRHSSPALALLVDALAISRTVPEGRARVAFRRSTAGRSASTMNSAQTAVAVDGRSRQPTSSKFHQSSVICMESFVPSAEYGAAPYAVGATITRLRSAAGAFAARSAS